MFSPFWRCKYGYPVVLAACGGFSERNQCSSPRSKWKHNSTYKDAISAIETTTVAMPTQTPTNTQIAPAGPPFVRESVPVLPNVAG